MAAPNVVNVATINGKTLGANLGTSISTYVTCSANQLVKVNSIIASNVDGTSNYDVSVYFYDSSAATSYSLGYLITVPAKSSVVIVGKGNPIYLEESDSIRASADTASKINLIVSYETIA